MALKKIIEVEGESYIQSSFVRVQTGIEKATFAAVCRITSISGNKTHLNISVLHIGDVARFERTYSFEPSVDEGSVNFIKQAYLYLKTLPEFSGAEDC
jgi:hypothetical protein